MEILKIFKMMQYKEMATPMESNLNLLTDASSEKVYAIMYHQIIGSLMCLTYMRPYLCLCGKLPEPIPNRFDTSSLDRVKSYSEVLKRSNGL